MSKSNKLSNYNIVMKNHLKVYDYNIVSINKSNLKAQRIDLSSKNQQKLIPAPRKNLKQMVQKHEQNIIKS